MDLEANKALSRRMLRLWAGSSTDDPRDFIAEDYVNRQEPYVANGSSNNLGLERWLDIVKGHRKAFPDCEVEILLQIAEGDKVATRWRFHGTNLGEYLGRPPTGRRAAWTGIEIDVIRNDKIMESWVDWDMHGQFEQLGFLG